MEQLAELLFRDLDYVSDALKDEFAAMAGSNLLITGGGGFLGYYLVHSALHWNQKHASEAIHITVYDNYRRGVPGWLTELQSDKYLRLVRHDVSTPLPKSEVDFQFIIHAAGIASPTYYRKYPIETMDTNIIGLRSLLEYSRERAKTSRPVEGFLFYSSSEIYGDPPPEKIPTSEDYRGNVSCTGPRACYDESKRYGETLCVNFARQYGIPISIARPFNNYGPGLKITDRRVIPDFAQDVFSKRDIVMLSDGSPKRTFCYSADAIIGYYKTLVKGRAGEAYNIGVESPEISMYELAEKIAAIARALIGYKGKVIRKTSTEQDYLVDNPDRRCPNIEKARAQLGYDPKIRIDEGLQRSMVWYHYHQTAEEA
jgi:nucleoside-diphosphate-sugar epimerase